MYKTIELLSGMCISAFLLPFFFVLSLERLTLHAWRLRQRTDNRNRQTSNHVFSARLFVIRSYFKLGYVICALKLKNEFAVENLWKTYLQIRFRSFPFAVSVLPYTSILTSLLLLSNKIPGSVANVNIRKIKLILEYCIYCISIFILGVNNYNVFSKLT